MDRSPWGSFHDKNQIPRRRNTREQEIEDKLDQKEPRTSSIAGSRVSPPQSRRSKSLGGQQSPMRSAHSFSTNSLCGADDDAPASNCVWVGNVSPELSEDDFKKVFEEYGRVVLLRMFPRSKCAFITFQSSASALASLQLEGKLVAKMCLTLNIGKPSRHLWVGNIGDDVTDHQLRVTFEQYGNVESVRVLRANKCAFVNYLSETEAMRASEALNGSKVGGQNIVINFQWENSYKVKRPSKSRQGSSNNLAADARGTVTTQSQQGFDTPSRQLFVGSIVPSVTDGTLWNLFSRFGEVEQIKGYANRGYAFIIFKSLQVSIWVREQMKLYPPTIKGRALVVNYGRPTEDLGLGDDVSDLGMYGAHPPQSLHVPLPVGGLRNIPIPRQQPGSHPFIPYPSIPGYVIPARISSVTGLPVPVQAEGEDPDQGEVSSAPIVPAPMPSNLVHQTMNGQFSQSYGSASDLTGLGIAHTVSVPNYNRSKSVTHLSAMGFSGLS
eukprot:gb/GEZN01006613.1/.p1 GENE.gb/GEZN01006613.1/~~gb/GEZN01006613.1/.p1  ORF type:complete len:522 (-),score=31.45 gb/GEZN01006613.1/:73-1557(-)